MKRPRIALIDGSGYIFRAFFALPGLTRKDGTPIGAVYGFANMLAKLLEDHSFDYIGVIFDSGRQNFRHEIFPEYKANRDETPPDLIPQFSLTREVCKAFNVLSLETPGYEADDLIASYAYGARDQGFEVTVLSSDKDLMQLMGSNIRLWDPLKNKEMTEEDVFAKFGVPPEQVVEVQSLMGDSTDNIPGVPGIGPKTAAQLIQTYGTLENLLEHLEELPKSARQKSLLENQDKALLSKKLVTLKADIPLEVPLEAFKFKEICYDSLGTFLKAQGFQKLFQRLQLKSGEPEKPKEYHLIQDLPSLEKLLKDATERGLAAFDTETTSLNAMEAALVGFSLCFEPSISYYIPVGHRNDPSSTPLLDSPHPIKQIPLTEALVLLKPFLENPAVMKIGQNLKYDMLVLKKYDIEIQNFQDTMLLSYVQGAGQHAHNMDTLADRFLNLETIKYEDVAGKGKSQITFDLVPLEKALEYAAEDGDVTLKLYNVLEAEVKALPDLQKVYETLELPLVKILVDMESTGIKVDPFALQALSRDFDARLKVLETKIHGLAGREFNVGSPKQLGEILFDEMQLSGGKKGKNDAYSTDSSVLENLALEGHLLPEAVLEWRGLAKLKSTYTESLIQQINPKTGRVHTSYSMATTTTGRLSSTDPNLQNIPIRTEEGMKIRGCFVAQPGHQFLSLDYSQIELRLLAHMANSDSLKNMFINNQDIHTQTASQIFKVPLNEVDSTLRRRAKAVNFGIIYGMGAFGLGGQLKISPKEAAQYIDSYFQFFPEIKGYMDGQKDFARTHGYVETFMKRRCYIPTINDTNANLRAHGERQAINAPLQGSNADIIKKAMIQIFNTLHDQGLKTKMLLQVHDELIFEVPEAEMDQALPLIKGIMESVVSLSLPLVVDGGYGKTWGDL